MVPVEIKTIHLTTDECNIDVQVVGTVLGVYNPYLPAFTLNSRLLVSRDKEEEDEAEA